MNGYIVYKCYTPKPNSLIEQKTCGQRVVAITLTKYDCSTTML